MLSKIALRYLEENEVFWPYWLLGRIFCDLADLDLAGQNSYFFAPSSARCSNPAVSSGTQASFSIKQLNFLKKIFRARLFHFMLHQLSD